MRRNKQLSDDLICVGSIGGSYGVQGELRIKSFCAMADDIETYSPLTREDGSGSFTIAIVRSVKGGFVVRIPDVSTKEQADALKGVQLYARRNQLPNLPDDEYYHSDLKGLKVFDTGGEVLGTVHSVQNHGAGDLIEVQLPNSSATVLVPFSLAVVPTVDLEAGRIIADPPDGLF
jgi:16S rRNA processing protein RimM